MYYLNLLKGRLGVYDKHPFNSNENTIAGVEHQATLLQQQGGNLQQDRMIKNKRRSLDRAVWNSYQAARILRAGTTGQPIRALINPNKLKMDYDDKILSVGYEHNFKCGDVIEWIGTKTFWLIYLQDIEELAYFKGDIRKCSYEIKWQDENGKHSTYAAIRGPVETQIVSGQKHGIVMDSPNYSLHLLIPSNEETKKYFVRYREFYLQNNETCWRVEAVDSISSPGIIEINAQEYYANRTEDNVEEGIVGGLIETIDPSDENYEIKGEGFIKVKVPAQFTFEGSLAAVWSTDRPDAVQLTINKDDPREVEVEWIKNYSGSFVLSYGEYSRTIVAESLF